MTAQQKTAVLIQKLKSTVSLLLNVPPESFDLYKEVILNEYDYTKRRIEMVKVNELYYHKPDDTGYEKETTINNFGVGRFEIRTNADFKRPSRTNFMAGWKFYEMPHCCGILVSCNASVHVDFVNKGVGTFLNTFREDVATHLGYPLLLCTDIASNTKQRAILKKNNWEDIYKFVNSRTKNTVYISVKKLKTL